MKFAGALALSVTITGPAVAASPSRPTVVELFTAQGCSSCPAAQAVVNALVDQPDLLPLTFSVTYWDALGWKDVFAAPAFTDRQRAYDRTAHREVATPQVILNGRIAVVGNDSAALSRAITVADRGERGPIITSTATDVSIGSDVQTARPATVWLVRYDPRIINVAVRAGENGGRTLPHRNVVRLLSPLGSWSGRSVRYVVPPSADPAWRAAVLVQGNDGGSILAAARLP